MQRPCDVCGESYEAKRATSKYCSDRCKMRKARGAVTAAEAESIPTLVPDHTEGPVTESALVTLRAAERVDSPLGQAALALARRVDLNRDTGAGLAALVKQFEATLGAATANVKSEQSALDKRRDELAARRAARGA
jgi:hypothetical protein